MNKSKQNGARPQFVYNQQVIFEKGDDFKSVFPEGKSGLGLRNNQAHEIEVFYVAKGTPAAESGFEKGDIVLAVNGIRVEYFDGLIALRRMFREPAGTEYVFTILRKNKEKDLTLTLRDLL